ncbi:MAG: glycosyltransferase [Lachnospiraceae bacterium]|nr:glycosyltransferase [Lachnospiraceae bacterium]
MSKRVFICAHANFPRGDATSNYIEYLSLALMLKDYRVYVLSRGENRDEDWDEKEQCYVHNGICYFNYEAKCKTTFDFLINYFDESKNIVKLLRKFEAGKDDIILGYTLNYFYIKKLYRYSQKYNMKMAMCITEWHQAFEYNHGILNPVYWLDKMGFERGIPMCGNVIPISRHLDEHFKKKGCSTLCMPILAAPPDGIPEKDNGDIVHFIYSGNAIHKDAIDMIVNTFASLSDEELSKMKLHFTGMKSSTVDYLKKKCGKDFDRIRPILEIHAWMEYDELVALYKKIDFLILLRRNNKVTISNFPSKVPEMMGYGIIPIVSQVGDYTQEYLTDDVDCIMVKECTIEAAKDEIVKGLNINKNRKQQMRENAYKTVNNKFAYSIWSDKIDDFLK